MTTLKLHIHVLIYFLLEKIEISVSTCTRLVGVCFGAFRRPTKKTEQWMLKKKSYGTDEPSLLSRTHNHFLHTISHHWIWLNDNMHKTLNHTQRILTTHTSRSFIDLGVGVLTLQVNPFFTALKVLSTTLGDWSITSEFYSITSTQIYSSWMEQWQHLWESTVDSCKISIKITISSPKTRITDLLLMKQQYPSRTDHQLNSQSHVDIEDY